MKAEGDESGTSDELRYAAAWRSLRTRRWTLGILALFCLPVVMGAVHLLPQGPLQASVAGMWMALFAASMIWMASFRCPKCGRFFWWTWTRRNPFTMKCLHCRTPVGSTPSDRAS